jgi:hypothetical protein
MSHEVHLSPAAAQQMGDGAIPEQVAADLGVSPSTLYRELLSIVKAPLRDQLSSTPRSTK